MSCSVLLSAWPICSEPVTFGGGITIENAGAPARALAPAANASAASHAAAIRASAEAELGRILPPPPRRYDVTVVGNAGPGDYAAIAETTPAGAMTAVRERDVHDAVTPRLGGLAMLTGVVAAMLIASNVPFLEGLFHDSRQPWAILSAAALVCLLGAADDRWDLDWMTKLAGQIIAAGILAWQGVAIVSLPIGNTLGVGSS